jgi:hypothetical protein
MEYPPSPSTGEITGLSRPSKTRSVLSQDPQWNIPHQKPGQSNSGHPMEHPRQKTGQPKSGPPLEHTPTGWSQLSKTRSVQVSTPNGTPPSKTRSLSQDPQSNTPLLRHATGRASLYMTRIKIQRYLLLYGFCLTCPRFIYGLSPLAGFVRVVLGVLHHGQHRGTVDDRQEEPRIPLRARYV